MQKVNTALLSFGMSGKLFHAPFIHLHPGFNLAGAWERSKQSIGEIYPGTRSYKTLEELLSDETIQLVVVNTPTSTHYDYAKQSLLAGKHIVVEKAFTTTVAEARELKSLSEKQGKKISVFQNRRWDSDFKTVQKIKQENLLGDIVEAEIHFDRYKPELSPKKHKETPGPGAGILKDLGPHIIDQALCLFGMPDSLFADIRITRDKSLVDDYIDILLYYPSLRVRLKAGYFVREPLPAFILHGVNGSFLKSRADVQETELQAGVSPGKADWGKEPESEEGLLHTQINGKEIKERVRTLNGNYYDYYDGVFQAISENKSMPVTCDDGIKVMQVIEAAIKSSDEKKAIDL